MRRIPAHTLAHAPSHLLLRFAFAATSSCAQTLHSDRAYRVGGDVEAPVVTQRVDPVYAPEAKEKRIAGAVSPRCWSTAKAMWST
jgi:hypothetical protein